MKMTALVSYHLSNDIKKKEYFRLFQAHLFRAHIFQTPVFWVLFIFRPICFKAFFYKSSRLLQTHKSSVGGKTTKKEAQPKMWTISILSSSNQGRHMGFHRFCQNHMGSHGSWRASPTGRFGLFHANSPIKGHSKTLRGQTIFSEENLTLPVTHTCNPSPFSSITNISCIDLRYKFK